MAVSPEGVLLVARRRTHEVVALPDRNKDGIAEPDVSRTIGFGKDGRLYVSIGSSCNVCVEEDPRRTTIQVMNADGSNPQPYARGLHNAIGFDWDPQTGRMWADETGQDGLGADFPPDEINLVEAGKH
jgi:glucose/arabinose dehydrogenase